MRSHYQADTFLPKHSGGTNFAPPGLNILTKLWKPTSERSWCSL